MPLPMPIPLRRSTALVLLLLLWQQTACGTVMAAQATEPAAATAETAETPESPASTPEVETQPWRAWHGILFRVQPPAIAAAAGPVLPIAIPVATVPLATTEPDADAPQGPVSYLFGSIHYGTLDELDIEPAVLQDALKETDTLVSEADADTKFDASYDHYRFLSPGLTLKTLLGVQPFEALETLLPQIEAERLQRFKPWLVLALLESRGEVASGENLDGQILQWSKDARLRQAHLETLREQMEALDCIAEREHATVLAQRIAEPWVLREQSERVLGYYRNRDLMGWLDEVDAVVGLDPRGRGIENRARQCLIEERNARWLVRLEPLLKAGRCFVAVGAIHLAGENGLINQLVRRGYTVVAEPI